MRGKVSPPKVEKLPVNCTHLGGRAVGVGWGCDQRSGAEGVTGYALLIGANHRARAVPGAELWHSENV